VFLLYDSEVCDRKRDRAKTAMYEKLYEFVSTGTRGIYEGCTESEVNVRERGMRGDQ
jgi:hypothetical protein